MSKVERLLMFREAGNVERAHCIPHHRSYTNGKHTYDMLLLLDVLYPGVPRLELVRAILYHDTHERWTGDIPGPVRTRLPDLYRSKVRAVDKIEERLRLPGVNDLTADETRWLVSLDSLEFLLWCEDQMAMGNANVGPSHDGTRRWFAKNMDTLPDEIRKFVLSFHWKRTSEGHEAPGGDF